MIGAAAAVGAVILAIGFGALWRSAERRLRGGLRRMAEIDGNRAQAAAAVQHAKDEAARLREILDALPIAVWRCRDHTLVDCNRSYAAALGISRETVLAEGRALVPTGREEPRAHASSTVPPVEMHVVIGGQRRLLELHEASSADGETIGYAIDRSDVESAQSQLWRHLDAHADVLESVSAAIAIFGPDRRLTFFNTAFAALSGIEDAWLAAEPTLGEILERQRESRRLPEFADFRAFKRERCAMFTSLIEPRHELMHLPDGRTWQVTVSPHPFGGLTFVYEDVSDRLALECSYNTLIQVQRATLDHLFEGIAVYGSDGRLKLHNPAFRAMWGLSSEDVAGDPHIGEIVEKIRAFIDDCGDWPRVREGIVAKVTAQTSSSGPLYRRDGSMLQVASVPLPDGEVLLTYLDVSDTARVERALRQRNEALETADRLKSEFIASVSHELRTPLNTVIGFAEILNNQYFGTLNPSQAEYCRGVLDSAHQLMSAINDILDLATIEAGYMVLERGPVDLPDVLQAVVGLALERARARGLDLSLSCPASIEPIEADERRLKQALFNLISNAVKFTPPGGAIEVAAARRGDELLLTVTDTWPPLAPSDEAPAFSKPALGERQTGSGLGLSLVKNLVGLHGGTVDIRAARGRGTRVACRLPAGRDYRLRGAARSELAVASRPSDGLEIASGPAAAVGVCSHNLPDGHPSRRPVPA
ncbi:MAG TPA: PAS-domain containing protein [Stellaceae bacterium]|jgi:signal transduction histidine kinase